MFHLIAYRTASYIFDMFPVCFTCYTAVSQKPQTNHTSRIVVIIFMKVLNFGSNILAGKFPISGLFWDTAVFMFSSCAYTSLPQ